MRTQAIEADADLEALIDSLTDAGRQVISAKAAGLQELYEEIRLERVQTRKSGWSM